MRGHERVRGSGGRFRFGGQATPALRKWRWYWAAALVAVGVGLWLGALHAGRFLVIDDPQPADVIIVLAGEAVVRPARGIEMLEVSRAPQMILDVPEGTVYGQSYVELAAGWRAKLAKEIQNRVSFCVIRGLSTQAEAVEAGNCIRKTGARRILMVTSDYHTRRAKAIFQQALGRSQGQDGGEKVANMDIFVAAAADPVNFGVKWWQRRQWAKTLAYEWIRLAWWEAVDRWGAVRGEG